MHTPPLPDEQTIANNPPSSLPIPDSHPSYLSSLSQDQRPPYSGLLLVLFIITYSGFWVLGFLSTIFSDSYTARMVVTLAAGLLLGVQASILIVDWRGYTTLDGLLQWRQMNISRRVLLFLAYIMLFLIVIGVYLLRKANCYLQQRSAGQWQPSATSRRPTVGMIVGTCVVLCAFLFYSAPASDSRNRAIVSSMTVVVTAPPAAKGMGATPSVAPTRVPAQVATSATATPYPISTPTPVSTYPPTATPTSMPTPTPITGVNGNPWGYDFVPGNYIYNPPADFCRYFSCVSNFSSGKGYIVECSDGQYSKFGGKHGPCSHHGKVVQPLYSH